MNVLFATPCYGGQLCVNYVGSILRLGPMLESRGIRHEFYFHGNDSLIPRARNDCVAYFMAGDYSHLFWIDADIGFKPAAVIRTLASGRDVAAGVYPRKSPEPSFPIDLNAIGEPDHLGFAEANEAPTGFMCITRGVFDKMRAAGIGRHEFFDTMTIGDGYLSEDYAFCHRWRSLGGKIHVDVNSDLSHQGAKLYVALFNQALEKP